LLPRKLLSMKYKTSLRRKTKFMRGGGLSGLEKDISPFFGSPGKPRHPRRNRPAFLTETRREDLIARPKGDFYVLSKRRTDLAQGRKKFQKVSLPPQGRIRAAWGKRERPYGIDAKLRVFSGRRLRGTKKYALRKIE